MWVELLRNEGKSPRLDIANPARDTPRILVKRTLAVDMMPPMEISSTASGFPVTSMARARGCPDPDRPLAPTSPTVTKPTAM